MSEPHDDSITHAFILEYVQRGFAEVHSLLDALSARIDRLMIVLTAGMFGITASIIGVAVGLVSVLRDPQLVTHFLTESSLCR